MQDFFLQLKGDWIINELLAKMIRNKDSILSSRQESSAAEEHI